MLVIDLPLLSATQDYCLFSFRSAWLASLSFVIVALRAASFSIRVKCLEMSIF